MTESDIPGPDDTFEPDGRIEASAVSEESEATNVCRVTALSMLLGEPARQGEQLREPLLRLGFSELASEALGRDTDGQFNLYDWFGGRGARFTGSESRVDLWAELNRTADSTSAGRLLLAVLGSPLERESAAAAAALVRFLPGATRYLWSYGPIPPPYWDLWPEMEDLFEDFPWLLVPPIFVGAFDEPEGEGDELTVDWNGADWSETCDAVFSRLRGLQAQFYFAWLLVTARLRLAIRSLDPITRSFAFATRMISGLEGSEPAPLVSSSSTPPGALVVSTMVHGTWGWKGNWWRPSGGFHKHVLHNHRPNLYNRGARFSWSGAYSATQRHTAATDLIDWASEVAPNGMQTVFAHSYGGEVAALAALGGTSIHELVLLSCPGTEFVNKSATLNMRVVDVRLPFDPVLAIAGTPQWLRPRPNVVPVTLKWSLDHGATHRENVWLAQSIAKRAGL